MVGVLLLVLRGKAPGGMLVLGICSAFWARLHNNFSRALQGSRFLEAPMPSLFHVVLPV